MVLPIGIGVWVATYKSKAAKGGLGWGQNHRGTGGRESPSGSLGSILIFKSIATSKFYAFLVVFNTFSPVYAYMFFRASKHHSTKSAKWGTSDTVCPPCLQVEGGNCPPAPPPMLQIRLSACELPCRV